MTLALHAYETAKKEIGTKETTGLKATLRIVDYLKSVNLNEEMQSTDETAWCAAFMNWCLQQNGGKGTRNAMARSFLNWGQESDGKEGDIVVFQRGNDGISGHVGFVVEKGLIFITVLGGNQSNQVKVSKYLRKDVLGYRTSLDSQLSEPTKGDPMEDLVQLLNSLTANINDLQAKLADANAAAVALANLKFEQGKESRQGEVDALKARIAELEAGVPGNDKIYSQVELDAKVAEAVAPLNDKVAALQVQVDGLPALVQQAVDAKVAEMVADFKAAQVDDAAFLAKYDKQ